jgi:hypothetical protein
MNARLAILVLFVATPAVRLVGAAETHNKPTTATESSATHRSLSAIGRDVRVALRMEASSRVAGQNVPEVIRLIELYRELASHPKSGNSLLLRKLGLQLRTRLENVRDRIERQHARLGKRAKNKETPSTLAVPGSTVLAQQGAGLGGAAVAQGAQPPVPQGGAAQIIDYGPELVDLIQRTISPATWDINGGNGAVVYFAPLRVIVVSAPGSVHDQVGDVLGQLRAAP